MTTNNQETETETAPSELSISSGSAQHGGEFCSGIEWFGGWLVDNAEGETITEELLAMWAGKAWQAHVEKQNTPDQAQR